MLWPASKYSHTRCMLRFFVDPRLVLERDLKFRNHLTHTNINPRKYTYN